MIATAAGQALNPAYDAKPSLPEGEITSALDEVQRLGKALAEARSNINAFIERMVVGENCPTATAAEPPRDRRPLNGGLTGSLRREIELADELAADICRLSERLRQIG